MEGPWKAPRAAARFLDGFMRPWRVPGRSRGSLWSRGRHRGAPKGLWKIPRAPRKAPGGFERGSEGSWKVPACPGRFLKGSNAPFPPPLGVLRRFQEGL